MSIQSFGEAFHLGKLLKARELARDMTYELSSLICPRMKEEEAQELFKKLCLKKGIVKQWHPPKIRFGPNTLKNFREPSVPYVLEEEDIFFIDIGPVIEGHEADYGETFVVGSVYEHKLIREASQKIFTEVAHFWQNTKSTGKPLYEYATKRASELGYTLNLGSDGHRIGDFPHHVHFKGGLVDCEETIIPNAWILEIHLLDPTKKFGAFFEDLLTDEY